jgi:chromosome partitioning protein
MTHVIAFAQTKGGVSKSSTAINVACHTSSLGLKTALLDLDVEQGTTLKWGLQRQDKARPLVVGCDLSNLDAVLDRLRSEGFEWIFLDLPGRRAPVASAGMMAADLIIIPAKPVDTDVEPSFHTVKTAIRAGRRYCYLMGIAPPSMDKQRARKVSKVLQDAGHPVCPVIIVQRLAVPDAISRGQGVNEFEPNGEAAKEFADFFEWLKGELHHEEEGRERNHGQRSKRRGNKEGRPAQGEKVRET